jgi:hypothetical protein
MVYLILVGHVQYVYFGWGGVVGVNQYCCNRKNPKGKVQFLHNIMCFCVYLWPSFMLVNYLFLALTCLFCSFGMSMPKVSHNFFK